MKRVLKKVVRKVTVRFLDLLIPRLKGAIKSTNWFKNQLRYTDQFVSNAGYRANLIRNYEVVNVGSNPARYAFSYDDVLGENWSTGTQNMDMDFEILKRYHSLLKQGAVVFIPLVPFSSVSAYLTWTCPVPEYQVKFYKILSRTQTEGNPFFNRMDVYYENPLRYDRKYVDFLLSDVSENRSLQVESNPMNLVQMRQDAVWWMEMWKKEFGITDLSAPLEGEMIRARKESVEIMQGMIDFLKERGYRPILVLPPVSRSLGALFTDEIAENYIYSFTRQLSDAELLDYMKDKRFSGNEWFLNALLMNVKGRKRFSRQILEDVGLLTRDSNE